MFKGFFYKRTCTLRRSSYTVWLDRKYCGWNWSKIWTNTLHHIILTFIYIENVVILVLLIVLLWSPKILFDRWFIDFSVHGDWQKKNIYLQRWVYELQLFLWIFIRSAYLNFFGKVRFAPFQSSVFLWLFNCIPSTTLYSINPSLMSCNWDGVIMYHLKVTSTTKW